MTSDFICFYSGFNIPVKFALSQVLAGYPMGLARLHLARLFLTVPRQ
jgi:hypothetical protein